MVVEFMNNNWNVFGDSACHVRLGMSMALWGSLGGLKGPQRNIGRPLGVGAWGLLKFHLLLVERKQTYLCHVEYSSRPTNTTHENHSIQDPPCCLMRGDTPRTNLLHVHCA